jgi:hypothetical protein
VPTAAVVESSAVSDEVLEGQMATPLVMGEVVGVPAGVVSGVSGEGVPGGVETTGEQVGAV